MKVFAIRLIGAVISVALWSGTLSAQSTTLTPAQLRQYALLATEQGAHARALEATSALLVRDPADISALIIQARAARALGQLELAETSVIQAWRLSESPDHKFQSALVRAQVLSTKGRRTAAQIWLRRAIQHAPNKAARAAAIRDFRYLRQVNPLRYDFDLQVAGSSNLNNGSRQETYELFGLPFQLSGTARALSGTEIKARGKVSFGGEAGQVGRSFGLSLQTRDYILSSEAKEIAPTAEGRDFAYRQVDVSHRRAWSTGPGRLDQLDVSLGRSWYGGDVLANIGSIAVSRRLALRPGQHVQFGASLHHQDRRDATSLSNTRLGLNLSGARVLAQGGQLGWSAALRQTYSDTQTQQSTSVSLGAQYLLPNPLLSAQAQTYLQIGTTRYDAASGFEARRDTQAAAGLSLTFREQAVYGFAPTVTVNASRTSSNDARFDTRRLSLLFGVRSAF